MTHDLLEPCFSPVKAMMVTDGYADRVTLTNWRKRGLLTVPSPESSVAMGHAYSLLGLIEMRIYAEAARSGIDRVVIAWGFRKRLQDVGALQLIKEGDHKPVAFYAGVGEVAEVELDAALRSGKLFEFERRDPRDPVYWLIGFERERNASRGKLVWVQTAATTKAGIGEAMLKLKPRASAVTGFILVDVTAAVNATYKVIGELARDRELLNAARETAGPGQ